MDRASSSRNGSWKVVKKMHGSHPEGRRKMEDLDWDGWKMLKRINRTRRLKKMVTEGSGHRRMGVCNYREAKVLKGPYSQGESRKVSRYVSITHWIIALVSKQRVRTTWKKTHSLHPQSIKTRFSTSSACSLATALTQLPSCHISQSQSMIVAIQNVIPFCLR
jgi:hypothetical protein